MKIRKLIEGKWYLSVDGGKSFNVDGDQSTEGGQGSDQDAGGDTGKTDSGAGAAAGGEAGADKGNGGTDDSQTKGFSAKDVEAAAKAVAEKIAEYQKVSTAAEEKKAKVNASTVGDVQVVDRDVKLFQTSRGKDLTMKESHTKLVAGWFKNFILHKAKHNPDAYYKMMDYAQKLEPINTETAGEGGNLVPTILYNVIVPLLEDMAVIRPNATVLDMTNIKTLDIPTISGKPVVSINGEALQKASTSMQFGKFTLTPYTLAAIVPVTEEMVSYSPFNIVTIVSQAFAESIAKAEDRLFAVGTGSSQPTGIDNYTYAKTLTLTNDLSWTHLNALYFGVTQQHRVKGSWLMSADTMAQLANMVDSQNRPIFDVAGVFQQSGLPSIKGRPVLEQNDIGNKIFFGNLKMYWIGASRQIRIDVADQATVRGQSMWERDMIAIRAEEKIDGEVADVRAFAEINGV